MHLNLQLWMVLAKRGLGLQQRMHIAKHLGTEVTPAFRDLAEQADTPDGKLHHAIWAKRLGRLPSISLDTLVDMVSAGQN